MFYTIFKSKLHLLHIKRSVYFFKSSINHEFKMIEEFKFNSCSQETDYQRPLFRQCGPQAMYLCFYYIQYNSIYISNCPIQYTIILFERMYIILLWQIHVHIRRKICAYFFYFLDLLPRYFTPLWGKKILLCRWILSQSGQHTIMISPYTAQHRDSSNTSGGEVSVCLGFAGSKTALSSLHRHLFSRTFVIQRADP